MRLFHAGSWASQESYEWSQRQDMALLLKYRRGVETIRDMIGDEDAG
jgi:hypothetical protein